MRIVFAALLCAALCPVAVAQDTGSVEGRVTSSVSHTGIAGAIITVEPQRVVADASGSFRVSGLPPGAYSAQVEANGFHAIERRLRIDSGSTARLDIELVPQSSIAGRVLDDEGNPVAGVRVEITQAVRGTGTTWTVWGDVTDSEGRYRVDVMPPGSYLAMARPSPKILGSLDGHSSRERSLPPPKATDSERRAWVRTYFPGVSDRRQAAPLILRAGMQLGADIRLLAVPVYTIRGMVYDDAGRPVDAAVSLVPPEAMEMPQAKTQAHAGAFEFSDVPAGEWRAVAESESARGKLRGISPALLTRHDVENLTIRLAAPFSLQAFVEPRGLEDLPGIELYPAGAPASGAVFSAVFLKRDFEPELRFTAVYPGRYVVNVFSRTPDYYLDAVRLGEQDVLGKEVALAEGSPPLHIVFKPTSAALRGSVENCGGASILLLPQDEDLWNFRFIRRGSCDSSGHYEIAGLRPGSYYALALDRIDSTGLDDLSTLRRLAAIGEKVQVDRGRVAYVELKISPWPD